VEPSGEFHIGTALNWTYFDIVARYKRMRGFNVLFPQGTP
jgi:valyl-tRNA synthetase